MTKASAKITVAFPKLDDKGGCITTTDGVARDGDTAVFASADDGLVGSAIGKCDAAKQKLVGKYVAGIAGCYAKAAAKAPGTVDNAPLGCTEWMPHRPHSSRRGAYTKKAASPHSGTN